MNDDSGDLPPHEPSTHDRHFEQAVTKIRAYLREGNTVEAKRRFALLTAELLPQISRRSEESLGRYGRELPQEGIAEALILFWNRLSDSGSRPGTLHLEIRFQQAFKTLLSDAFKRVRTEKYGLTQDRGAWEDLETETVPENEDTSKASAIFDGPDNAVTKPLYTPWSHEATSALLAGGCKEEWLDALQMEADGYKREEIAALFGTTVKTIYNWTREAKARLKVYLVETYSLDRHGRPIID